MSASFGVRPLGPDRSRLVIWLGELGFQRMKAMARQRSHSKRQADTRCVRASTHPEKGGMQEGPPAINAWTGFPRARFVRTAGPRGYGWPRRPLSSSRAVPKPDRPLSQASTTRRKPAAPLHHYRHEPTTRRTHCGYPASIPPARPV